MAQIIMTRSEVAFGQYHLILRPVKDNGSAFNDLARQGTVDFDRSSVYLSLSNSNAGPVRGIAEGIFGPPTQRLSTTVFQGNETQIRSAFNALDQQARAISAEFRASGILYNFTTPENSSGAMATLLLKFGLSPEQALRALPGGLSNVYDYPGYTSTTRTFNPQARVPADLLPNRAPLPNNPALSALAPGVLGTGLADAGVCGSVTNNSGGGFTKTLQDVDGDQLWTTRVEIYDAQNRLVNIREILHQGLGRLETKWTLDPQCGTSVIMERTDGQNRLDQRVTGAIGGAMTLTDLDQASDKPWVTDSKTYDAQGRLDSKLTVNDGGDKLAVDYDQANALPTIASTTTATDAQNRADWTDQVYDAAAGGGHLRTDYDQANASPTVAFTAYRYDAQNRLDWTDQATDAAAGGGHTVIDRDQDSTRSGRSSAAATMRRTAWTGPRRYATEAIASTPITTSAEPELDQYHNRVRCTEPPGLSGFGLG